MIALDSSVWIELWKDPSLEARLAAAAIEHGGDLDLVLVPSTVVHETWRWILRYVRDERYAAVLGNAIAQHVQVPIDAALARAAARISIDTGLAAADATILAAARERPAHLLTHDSDFAGIDGVTVLPRDAPH